MTLELMICTLGEGIRRVEAQLLEPRPDVRYLVSCQYDGEPSSVPEALQRRADVRVIFQPGRGLSRNRNNALCHASGDILKVCDDDERWTNARLDLILDTFARHPEYDIVHFQIEGTGKRYPNPSVSSCEMALRRKTAGQLRFDERFGLGSPCLCGGEEDVFLCDARRKGLSVHYEPQTIAFTPGPTTGADIRNPRLQRTKGAVFYYTRGLAYALLKSLRESLGWALRRRMNPITLLANMLWGINYIRRCQP